MQRSLMTITLVLALLAALPVFMMAQAPKVNLKNPVALKEQAPATFKASFDTSAGVFVVEVTRAWAPNGADRFYNLVKNGFYDDCRFFRVIPGFMVQFGINGDPSVQAAWRNANIPTIRETEQQEGLHHVRDAGPNTGRRRSSSTSGTTPASIHRGLHPSAASYRAWRSSTRSTAGTARAHRAARGQASRASRLQGNAYLQKDFPKLDHIKTATIQ